MNTKLNKNITIVLLGDFLLFFLAILIIVFARYNNYFSEALKLHFIEFLPAFFIYEIVLFTSGILDKKFVQTPKRIFDVLLPAHLIATLVLALYFYFISFFETSQITPRTNLLLFSLLLFIFIYSWKILRMKHMKSRPIRALMIGDDREIEELFSRSNFWDMRVISKLPRTESTETIGKILKEERIEAVIVSFDDYPNIHLLYPFIFDNIIVYDANMLKEEISEKIDLNRINEVWFLKNVKGREDTWFTYMKRFIDLLLSIPVLILYALAYPILAYIIKKDGGDVFFEMDRVGKGRKVFTIRKFRSMSADPVGESAVIDHKKVVTKIGEIMRKTGLDELPQVMSVIKGDMSFIGPRPEIPSLVEKYEKEIPFYQMRHLVQPGLSGWAQVMQENAPHHTADVDLTREKLAFDLYFIKHHSIFMYFKIVMKTAKSILNRTNHG